MEYKVESVLASGDKDLQDILNNASAKVEAKGYKIITIMFIGNNPQGMRIYQIVAIKE